MIVRIKQTYSKDVNFSLFNKLPLIGDGWTGEGYDEAHIYYIRCVNDEIAENTAGNPTNDFDFYDIYIETDDGAFIEHICIRKEVKDNEG